MFTRRLGLLLGALVVLIAAGTIAFSLAEGTSIGYGFVWTLDTVTTLGAIQDPHNTAGRVVVVALELLGIGTLFYGLATVAEFFVSGQLTGLLEERRLQRMIDSYSDHYIICGFGRVGRQVARDLGAAGRAHIAIDHNPEHREQARELGVQYIENYAAEDEVLLRAGIERARGVIACVDSDAENIFITLTARGLRPDILIIARASAEDCRDEAAPRRRRSRDLALQDLGHRDGAGGAAPAGWRRRSRSPTTGWRRSRFRHPARGSERPWSRSAVTRLIVALRRTDGRLEPQPAPQSVIDEGDMVVAIGTPASLERLEDVFQPIALRSP